MGTNHGRNPAVQIAPQGGLFTGRFSMKIDQYYRSLSVQFLEQRIGRAEGAFQVAHEYPPFQIDDADFDSGAGGKNPMAATGSAGRIVGRAQQAFFRITSYNVCYTKLLRE